MADRSIVVRLRAEVDGFTRAMGEATKATERTAKGTEDAAKKADTSLGRMVQSAEKNRAAWDQVGGTLVGFGAASVGALGLATKAAMDWESSWAGVQKTVDGTAPQMAALEDGLRGLARELPASHTEIAAVAEAAGQLGIETPNILGFTRTMINMGEATNLTAEEAATSLARFSNVTGTAQGDIGKLGAAIVGLGNNYATTESEILDMSMRLAGSGTQAGLTEGDILGVATAMSSVGIEAEAGGSAMSTTMKRIGKAVDEGGASLDLFAQVAGMTAEEFSTAWQNDPTRALDGFITGLSGVESQGLTTNGVLAELGITGIRESDSLLRLSAASSQGADGMSLLASAVADGNAEFDKGSALIEEASKRYQTAESRIAMAKNALVDAGISIGGVVLPAFADLADVVADAAGWFAGLPGPVHGVVAALGGVAGAGSLAAGSFLLIFPRVMDTVQAFKTLNTDMPGVAGGLGKVGKAALVAGGAFVGLQILGQVVDHFAEARITAEEFAAELMNASATSEITASSIDSLVAATGTGNAAVTDLGNALEILDAGAFAKFMDQANAGFGIWDTQTEIAVEQIGKLDQAITTMAQSGNADQMTETFKASVAAAEEYGYTAEDLIAQLPGLRTELTGVATSMGLTADDATLAKIAMGEIVPSAEEAAGAAGTLGAGMDDATGAVEEQVDALAELQDALQGTSDLLLGVRGSARSFEEAIDAANAAVEENGRTLDITTEKGRANEAALDGIAAATQSWANEAEAAGASAEELDGIMSSGRESFISAAEAMGMSSGEATALADSLGLVPEFVSTEVVVNTQTALDQAIALTDSLASWFADPTTATVDADTAPAAQNVNAFKGQTAATSATVGVDADIQPAMEDVYRLDATIADSGGTVTINGDATPGNNVLNSLMGIINNSDGSVTIDGKTYPADQALGAAIDAINRSGGTVDIDGDPSGANAATRGAKRNADGTTGTIDVNANASSANSSINSAARPRSSHIQANASTAGANAAINNAARNRTSTITVFQSIKTSASARYATGGAVYGPGTGTSDSIPALLSNGEHIMTAREVAMLGGQGAAHRMRQRIRAGALRFADGGGVQGGGYAPTPVMAPVPRMSAVPGGAVDFGALGPVVAAAVRSGMESASVVATVTDRVAAGLYKRGSSASTVYGGGR